MLPFQRRLAAATCLISAAAIAPGWAQAQTGPRCYLHAKHDRMTKTIAGKPTACWHRIYVTSPATAVAGYEYVGAAGSVAGPTCVPFMASTTANWATQTGWSCFKQTFNGATQIATPPGAW